MSPGVKEGAEEVYGVQDTGDIILPLTTPNGGFTTSFLSLPARHTCKIREAGV